METSPAGQPTKADRRLRERNRLDAAIAAIARRGVHVGRCDMHALTPDGVEHRVGMLVVVRGDGWLQVIAQGKPAVLADAAQGYLAGLDLGATQRLPTGQP